MQAHFAEEGRKPEDHIQLSVQFLSPFEKVEMFYPHSENHSFWKELSIP